MPEPIQTEGGRLTSAQSHQYNEDGFLFPIRAVDKEKAQSWRAELEKIEDEWLDNGLPLALSNYKRVNAQVVMPLANEIAQDPAILDAVEGVLGPDIMVYSVEFFIKEPRTRQMVSMHQDLTYWGLGATQGLTTAWLALSPATVESGCMDFVRGSHKNEILPHNDSFSKDNLLSRGQEVAVEVQEEDKTRIILDTGEMSLHHGLTIHGSGPNSSDDRRIGAVVRYCRPDVLQQVGDVDYAYLVRGEDRFGNFQSYDLPETLFSETALATYEEIRASQSKTMMKGAKGATGLYSA